MSLGGGDLRFLGLGDGGPMGVDDMLAAGEPRRSYLTFLVVLAMVEALDFN